MPEVLKKDASSFAGMYQDAHGRYKPCFNLDRELTDKRHDNVVRDIRAMLEQLVDDPELNHVFLHFRHWLKSPTPA